MQFHWREAVRSTVLSNAFIERQRCSITSVSDPISTPIHLGFTAVTPVGLHPNYQSGRESKAWCETIGHVWLKHTLTEERERLKLTVRGSSLSLSSVFGKMLSLHSVAFHDRKRTVRSVWWSCMFKPLNALNWEAHSVLPDVQLVYSVTKLVWIRKRLLLKCGARVLVQPSNVWIKLSNLNSPLSTGLVLHVFSSVKHVVFWQKLHWQVV